MKPIVWRRLPLPTDYYAINLMGLILSRRPLTTVELRHELIHSRQQRELLYVGFFVWYVAEWLFWLLRLRSSWRAYLNISFEQEAYAHEAEPDYLARRRPYAFLRLVGSQRH